MGLIAQIKNDIELITSNTDGFGVSMTFTAPTSEVATINGLHKKHHLGIDQHLGTPVNTKTASVSFSEKFLIDVNYPVRNASGIVNLKGHLVAVKDSTGTIETYIIEQWFPDETIGLIVCILGTYE